METTAEFILILDADQILHPEILDHTLGFFTDPKVALIQTPQWCGGVSAHDPLGSHAPHFYGPIQQGKNGWNAAFFCGSNAILRREALAQHLPYFATMWSHLSGFSALAYIAAPVIYLCFGILPVRTIALSFFNTFYPL